MRTFLYSECVLVYLEKESVNGLIKIIGDKFRNVTMVDYEMCNTDDNFGKIMINNF